MNLTSSGGSSAPAPTAAPAAPAAPAASSIPTPAILSHTNSPKLPPARQTKLEGDVSLDFDREEFADDAPPVVEKQESTTETPANEPSAEKTEERDPFDFETPELKEELKKLEGEKKEEKEEKEEPVVDPNKPAEKPKAQEGRKYTGDKDLDGVLRGLRNNDFNAYKDQITEWKKAFDTRGQQPKYLAAHPEAFKLSKDYQAAETSYNMSRFEYDAAINAKRAMLEKKDVNVLEGYDKKTGNPIYKTFKPDKDGNYPADLTLFIDEDIKAVSDGLRANETRYKTFGETHKKLVAEERRFIDDGFKKVFPKIDEKTFTEAEKSYKSIIDPLIPDSYTPEDARRLAYYSMVSHMRLAALVNQVVGAKKSAILPAPRKGPAADPGDTISLKNMFSDED